MKKWIAMLCAGGLMLGMIGCGNADSGDSSQSSDSSSASSVESTQPSLENSTEDSQESGTQPEGETTGWSEEMEGVKKAVTDALGEDYWPNSAMEPDMLETVFGITSDMYDDYMAEMPMISMNVDTLVVIKAKEGQADAVETALNDYRENLVGDTMQYPMNLGKIQASRIEKVGDYVCFVQLGADTTEAMENGDEAVIEKCQAANEMAIEAIGQLAQ